jgi:alcohol dehydrogenase class IV
MRFEFATATEILFGAGTARLVADRARAFGDSVFLVTGLDQSRAARFVADLTATGETCTVWPIAHEPTVDDAVGAVAAARSAGANVVVGIGGGSVIDLAKAVAALLANPGEPDDYLEVVGRGKPLTRPTVPFIAVPTTAGTGSEVTRNAVLAVPSHGVKVSMRSPLMLPRLAIVDPELTQGLPPALTAFTGMDALTQLIEPYLSVRANPLTDAVCVEGIARVARSLRRAVADGADLDARTDMSLASLFGGLALANAGLGGVHGFAAPVGARFDVPHGAACAALLPAVLRVNVDALRAREPGSPALGRVATVARLLTGDDRAGADECVAWLERLRLDLGIPPLGHYGITGADIADICEAAARASSMRGNCIALDASELRRVVLESL